MITLLLAAAGCSAADVVLILKKMRVAVRSLRIDVTGTRRATEPRRYMSIRFRFEMSGDGLDAAKAERAVALSIEKYCSVVASLAPDITVEHEVVLV
jgi:putative redox protein